MTQTRVRWSDDEKLILAKEIIRLRLANPELSLLTAARDGQSALPETRRREFKAWSQLESTLQQFIDAAAVSSNLSNASADVSSAPLSPEKLELPLAPPPVPAPSVTPPPVPAPSVTPPPVPAPSVTPPPVPAPSVTPPPVPAPSVASVTAVLDQLKTESVLRAALQSPALEQALTDLFTRAMATALSRLNSSGYPATADTPAPIRAVAGDLVRVLVAGFAGPELKKVAESLSEQYEVRTWTAVQGPQLFETLANICTAAVIPQEFGDEIGEALDQFKVKVLRHEGNTARLQERLSELLSTESS